MRMIRAPGVGHMPRGALRLGRFLRARPLRARCACRDGGARRACGAPYVGGVAGAAALHGVVVAWGARVRRLETTEGEGASKVVCGFSEVRDLSQSHEFPDMSQAIVLQFGVISLEGRSPRNAAKGRSMSMLWVPGTLHHPLHVSEVAPHSSCNPVLRRVKRSP